MPTGICQHGFKVRSFSCTVCAYLLTVRRVRQVGVARHRRDDEDLKFHTQTASSGQAAARPGHMKVRSLCWGLAYHLPGITARRFRLKHTAAPLQCDDDLYPNARTARREHGRRVSQVSAMYMGACRANFVVSPSVRIPHVPARCLVHSALTLGSPSQTAPV